MMTLVLVVMGAMDSTDPQASQRPMRNSAPPCNPASYTASQLELEWFRKSAHNRICQTTLAQQETARNGWLTYSARHQAGRRVPEGVEQLAISELRCGDGRVAYLEPLTGLARHPLTNICARAMSGRHAHRDAVPLNATGHLIPMTRCGASPFSRSVLFDVGAGGPPQEYYAACLSAHPTRKGALACAAVLTRGGASVPWWVAWYERRCIQFDRIFAWERTRYDPNLWWATLAPAWRMRTSFYNVGVDAEPAVAENQTSVLRWLRTMTSPDDFVVLKVDIDHSPTECV